MLKLFWRKEILTSVSRKWKTSTTLTPLSEKWLWKGDVLLSRSVSSLYFRVYFPSFLFFSSFLLTDAFALVGFAELAVWMEGGWQAQQSELSTALPNSASLTAARAPRGQRERAGVPVQGLGLRSHVTGIDGQWEKSPGWPKGVLRGWQVENVVGTSFICKLRLEKHSKSEVSQDLLKSLF